MNPRNRTLIIVLAALGLVVAAGVAAFVLSGDDGGESSTTTPVTPAASADTPPATGADAPTSAGGEVAETRPVEVSGAPLPTLEDPAADPAVGQPLPLIAGASFDGAPVTVGGATDGPTMYVFLAHWCPHCNDEIPELLALDDRGEIPAGLDIVGISTATAADRANYPPSEWIVDKGWRWPVMADDELATSFLAAGGSGFPYSVLADADGNVLARAAGSRPADVIKTWLDVNLA